MAVGVDFRNDEDAVPVAPLTRLETLVRVRKAFLETRQASYRTAEFRLDVYRALSAEIDRICGA